MQEEQRTAMQTEYTADQRWEIAEGIRDGLDVSVYAKPEFPAMQMREIRLGLNEGLPVAWYAKTDYDWLQMREIRKGLEQGISVAVYADPTVDFDVMRQIRKGLLSGVDLSRGRQLSAGILRELRKAMLSGVDISGYVRQGYETEQLRQIRHALRKGLDLQPYISTAFRGASIREIRLGLEARLDVSVYADPEMNWQQMREIRLGLEHRLSVAAYRNPFYSWQQMREIRLGLEEGLPVETYSSLMYPPSEMHKRHLALLEREAMQTVRPEVAPVPGKDGWYEFFVDTEDKRKPKMLEDGSVDYQNMRWFETVTKGQKIAVYHEAQAGTPGRTADGSVIPAPKGKEKKMLSGKGFLVLPDGKTYVADTDGRVEVNGSQLIVSNMLVVRDVTAASGNIAFNGSVHVTGMIGEGAEVRAKGDILVDGFVEGAFLEADGDIILRKGHNAAGKGRLHAKGDIMAQFLESANLQAGGNIRANACLGSDLYAGGKIEISGTHAILAGGTAFAEKGITAGNIGNAAGIFTRLVVENGRSLSAEEDTLREKMHAAEQELQLLRHAYFDFRKKYTPEQRNNHAVYLKLESAIYTKQTELEQMSKRRNALARERKKLQAARITATGTLYEGVQVELHGMQWNAEKMQNVTVEVRNHRIVCRTNVGR